MNSNYFYCLKFLLLLLFSFESQYTSHENCQIRRLGDWNFALSEEWGQYSTRLHTWFHQCILNLTQRSLIQSACMWFRTEHLSFKQVCPKKHWDILGVWQRAIYPVLWRGYLFAVTKKFHNVGASLDSVFLHSSYVSYYHKLHSGILYQAVM